MTTSSEPGIERRASGAVLVATCVSTLVVNANTSAVAILLPGDQRGHRLADLARCSGR